MPQQKFKGYAKCGTPEHWNTRKCELGTHPNDEVVSLVFRYTNAFVFL